MKFQIKQTVLGGLFGFLMIAGFQNCSKVAATDIQSPSTDGNQINGNPSDPSCQIQLIDSLKTVKVLFLVDTSGSNVGTNGSDIGKKWRSDVLQKFISRYQSKSNFYYGLATFQGSSAKPQITSNGQPVFTNDINLVNQGVTNFMNTPDSGQTPYKPALALAKSMIAADLAKSPSTETSYAVVMISDGAPTDYPNGPDSIIPDVTDVLSPAPKQISVNSVFYYGQTEDPNLTKYLEAIAQTGNGSFVTANSNDSLQIDDVIKVPQTVCK